MSHDLPQASPPQFGHVDPLGSHQLVRSLVRSCLIVVGVFVIGVVGYLIIGGEEYHWVDAVYMTTITLTTVGYGEVIDLSASKGGRIFTTILLLGGVGAFLYFISNLTAFLVEGNIRPLLWRKRMKKSIAELSGHTIICGGGNTGQYMVQEMLATDRPFVLIEQGAQRVAELAAMVGTDFPAVLGDATEDETLKEAGIVRASGLVACVSNDKDNLIVTVSARILNPGLRIICRCIEQKVENKILKAGADAVVSPSRIGGLRMISEMVRPTAVSFLDLMLRDKQSRLRVESTEVRPGASLAGESVGALRARGIADLLVVAVSHADGQWLYNPPAETGIEPGMSVVYIANPEARLTLEQLAGHGA